MTSILTYMLAPVVGGVIGYVTNDIAIRMLFRPHKPKYLFGRQLPFTPGLIPKERDRLAAAVGDSISRNLISSEVLERTLLSDDVLASLGQALDRLAHTLQHEQAPLGEVLARWLGDNEVRDLTASSTAGLTDQLHRRLADDTIGQRIAHIAVQHVMKKTSSLGHTIGDALADEGIGRGGGIGDAIKRGIGRIFGRKGQDAASNLVDALAQPVEDALAKNINEMLRDNSRQIVGDLVGAEADKLLARPVCELLAGKDEQIARAHAAAIRLYRHVVTTRLPLALEAVDVSRMVRQRIAEMDVVELEHMVLDVINREIRAIVWLGALLGAVIGTVNAFF